MITFMEKPYLINIIGIDGCGKGTQIELLRKRLLSRGVQVEVTKAYDLLEKSLFSKYIETASQTEIMFLFQSFHTKQRLATEEALQRGKVVISDRWDETYFAYHRQNGFLSRDKKLRNKLNEIAYAGLKPHLSFLLNVSPEVVGKRCINRGADFFDKKGIEHHTKSARMHLKIAKENNENYVILNGEDHPIEIHYEILKHIDVLLF